MNILAVSTSGRAASAALIRDGVSVRMKLSDDGLTHSETIMPIVDALFSDGAPFSFDEVDAFAADMGPGSFTGVRIGVCIANAFAMASGKPVVGISALEALARAASGSEAVCALVDARNGNGYAALYRGAEELIPPSAVSVAEFLPFLPQDAIFTGDGAEAYRGDILKALPKARFADAEKRALTADMLALPAFEALQKGRDTKEIFPLYLRPSQAERMYRGEL